MGRERRHRAIEPGASFGRGLARCLDATRGRVPSGVGCRDQRGGQLVTRTPATRLLFGLGRESPSLRPELAEDVVHAGEIRLGFGELLLGPAPAALMPTDPRDLLEQWSPLFGPKRERLIDHALADEEEGVVGEVGAVEEVHEVAQAHPLAIQEIVVLAGAIEPAAKLDDRVLDRQQPIGVVDHELDVGHPEGRTPFGTGPDDVLGLPGAERSALLAEGPPERVRQVALAGAVRADDRADARPEGEMRPLGKRLDPLEPYREEPRRAGHEGASGSAARAVRISTASAAAAVSALRREAPTPIPRTSSPTMTSTRKTLS